MKKYQRQNPYNIFLPYASEIEADADRSFDQIMIYFKNCLKPNLNLIEISKWVDNLEKYLDLYGFRFPLEDHVWLVKLFYGFLISENVDHSFLKKISKALFILIKKDYLLLESDLIIEWKPLYHLYYKFADSKERTYGLVTVQSDLLSNLQWVIAYLRPFFSQNSTQEMLDEWRPLLCPHEQYVVSINRGKF